MLNLLFSLNVILWVAAFLFLILKTKNSVYSPLFWYYIFHFVVFVYRPVCVLYFDFDFVFNYMRLEPTEAELKQALWVAMLGLVSISCGYYAVARQQVYTLVQIEGTTRRMKIAYGVFVAFAAPIVLYSIATTSQGIQGDRIGGVYVLVGTTGYIIDAQLMVLPLALLWLVVNRFRPDSFIPLLAFLAYSMVFGRVRWMMVVAVIAGYLMYCQYVKRRVTPWPIVLFAPVVLVVFTLKGISREIYLDMVKKGVDQGKEVLVAAPSWRDKLDSLDFANYDYLVYITSVVPNSTGSYTYFTQWLQLFTEPIPRMLWHGKPVGAPIQFFDLNDYGNFIGLSNSLVGDGWMSFGWIGVIVTCGLAGAILGYIFKYVAKRTHDPVLVCAYCIFVALTIQLYRDGGISIFKFCLFAVIPLLVLRWWAGRGGVVKNTQRPNKAA